MDGISTLVMIDERPGIDAGALVKQRRGLVQSQHFVLTAGAAHLRQAV
jgi:hypothetical protein